MSDVDELGRLGYAQELIRRMGGFSSFAVSFSIISVLTGCITAYADAFAAGGPASLGLGWPLVSAGTLLVALAMAELASAFPTAGALYHWSALLGGAGAGWFTAAINIMGQLAIVAAIDLGCANELAPIVGIGPLPLLAAILASHAVINIVSVRVVAWLNDFSATVHIVGVVVIVGALLALGRAHPAGYFFSSKPNGTSLGFMNGLVLSMFTFTGYDASAHLSEETHDPARRTPWGILSSVLVSAVFGYLLLGAITLAVGDDGVPLSAMTRALGDRFGRGAMSLAIAAMWFCGLSSVTSASRTVYAFARDGGLPASRVLARVHPTTRTPLPALLVVTVVPLLLVLGTYAFSSAGLFDVMAKMATMGLYVSYAIPILLGANARRAGRWKRLGPFHLRGYGVLVAWCAVAWCALVLVVCSLPPNFLAAAMLAGVLLVLVATYVIAVRSRFKGPKVDLAMLER
jgi:amino acid transporter